MKRIHTNVFIRNKTVLTRFSGKKQQLHFAKSSTYHIVGGDIVVADRARAALFGESLHHGYQAHQLGLDQAVEAIARGLDALQVHARRQRGDGQTQTALRMQQTVQARALVEFAVQRRVAIQVCASFDQGRSRTSWDQRKAVEKDRKQRTNQQNRVMVR
jgi:hypothetical protein